MYKKAPLLLALALLAVGSCASAQVVYERTYAQPYSYGYGYPAAPAPWYGYNRYYAGPGYYYGDPSVTGLIDRTAKTGIGVSGKAVKEAFKAIF